MGNAGIGQRSLFGREEPRCDLGFESLERTSLAHGAWIELARGWLSGHAALFDHLESSIAWRSEDRMMYQRRVDVPRLYAMVPQTARHPALVAMQRALDARYRTTFDRLSLALYRDGRDSVAWHGDYVARELLEDTLVATVSVGSPRKFFLKPAEGGRSISFTLGFGDLLVMGGSIQRTYKHCVPKVASAAPRIAIMYRPTFEE